MGLVPAIFGLIVTAIVAVGFGGMQLAGQCHRAAVPGPRRLVDHL